LFKVDQIVAMSVQRHLKQSHNIITWDNIIHTYIQS